MGYYNDEFLPYVLSLPSDHVNRRDPEISRGYWARVTAIRTLVDKFIRVSYCKSVEKAPYFFFYVA